MKLLKTLSLLLLTGSLAGCISDNLANCFLENNVYLNFSYLNFPDHINRVTVGIFDAEGLFVESRQVEKAELNQQQRLELFLSPGDYTAICWANAFNDTQINEFRQNGTIANGEVSHPNYGTNATIPTNDSLYYGRINLTTYETQSTTETVNFTPAHIKLRVIVKGLSNTAQGTAVADYPLLRINNLEPAYDFDMQTKGARMSYFPAMTVNTAKQLASAHINVLRFQADNPIEVDVVDNATDNNILWKVDLKQFIIANSININNGEDVTISMLIEFIEGNVNVSVGNWDNVPSIPEI